MKTVKLYRGVSENHTIESCTFGIMYLEPLVSIYTLELPWKDNKKFKSCIPIGRYLVKKRWSPRFKHHWHIKGVKGRTWILIHPGNTVKNTSGCILVGLERRGKVLYKSRDAIKLMFETLPNEFYLEVS